MIGKSLAHYEILDLLGKGGMGEVYRARDTKLGREVAIKVLPTELSGDPERRARFEREARTLASLQHPNVASIYGFEEIDGSRFLVMELVEGKDLGSRLEAGALPLDETVRIARQIAKGLEAAHESGIVHRDLKPANIMLNSEGVAKILDFGLARAWLGDTTDESATLDSPTITAAMTQAGIILGTAAYMSPEQARGRSVDRRSDIWAFGTILWEMVTGRRLFEGETISDTLAAVLRAEPDWKELPWDEAPQVCHLIQRCLVRDPRQRLRDVGEARIALGASGSEGSVLGSASTLAPTTAMPGFRAWIPWTLAAILAVALGITLLRPTPTPSPRVTRFSIDPPPHTSIREFTLSPDGSALAFIVNEPLGNTQLWIRSFDQSEPEHMPGTDGASFPFWAPDGRSLGFFSGGKLRRMDLATKTSQTLADAPNARGADWSMDGTILFTPEGLDVLYAIPATGGTPTPVTQLGVDEHFPEEATHRFPHFVAGTKTFTYVSQDPGATLGNAKTFVASFEAPNVRKPIVIGLTEAYAPPGYLLFVREGTLIAQPFDARRLELFGEAHPLASDIITYYPNTGRTSFSVSNTGVLAYRSVAAPRSDLAWYDRSGNRVEAITQGGATYIAPALSPSGRRVAYMSSEAGAELWILDLDRNTTSRLLTTDLRLGSPCWLTDDTLLYVHGGNIYKQRIDRSDSREALWLKPEDDTEDVPFVTMFVDSRDGSLVILQNWDSSTDWDLWTLRPGDGAKPEVLVRKERLQRDPRLSPDGRWVAYASDEPGRLEIYVQSVDDPGQTHVVSSQGGQLPEWSPDGRELYYLSPEFDLMAVRFDAEGVGAAGTAQPLFRAPLGAADVFGNLRSTPQLVTVRDGRFLFNVGTDATASQRVDIVLNWDAALGRNGSD